MVKRRGWTYTEERILVENYNTKTIKELESMLAGRKPDSINCKIKRLKASGKITDNKDPETVKRSYEQRELQEY